jgi:hypothetical protein
MIRGNIGGHGGKRLAILRRRRARFAPTTAHHPISTEADAEGWKPRACYWAWSTMDAAVLPIGGLATLVDPIIGRESGVVEDKAGACSAGHGEHDQNYL